MLRFQLIKFILIKINALINKLNYLILAYNKICNLLICSTWILKLINKVKHNWFKIKSKYFKIINLK